MSTSGDSKRPGEHLPEPGQTRANLVARWRRRARARAGGGTGYSGGSDIEGSGYLGKWLALGIVVGIVAGSGALLFVKTIELMTMLFLDEGAGYQPPAPVGEGVAAHVDPDRPWMLPVITGLGGFISGLLVFGLAPETAAGGTDSALQAIHHRRGFIRPRVIPIKLIASAVTIGSGGSAGREGPAAQISAAFGSLIGQRLGLSGQDRRILVIAGMGAGIGAIFRAPLGGALIAAESLYRHDIEVESIIPSLIASIVAFSVFGAVEGYDPIFGSQPELAFGHPVTLVYYALLGVICGAGGILFSRVFSMTTLWFEGLRLPLWSKPGIGGVLVGAIGVLVPHVIHTGYGWTQIVMTDAIFDISLWIILILPLAKMVATSFSVGSGAAGGIFGPGMVIGGLFGAAFWRLGYDVLPEMPSSPGPLVIVGMMALFGSIAHTPLAVMLMVAEMTGNLSMLAPAMIAVAIATALVRDHTIYPSQLPNRASAPAHRIRFSYPLLSSLFVRDAMTETGQTLHPDDQIRTLAVDHPLRRSGAIIVGDDDRYIGILSAAQLNTVQFDSVDATRAAALLDASIPVLSGEDPLDAALERLAETGVPWLAVVEDGSPVGRLSARSAIAAYRTGMQGSVRRASSLPRSAVLLEARLPADSPLVGRQLRELRLPGNTLVVAILRDGEAIFPRAMTRLEVGDAVTFVTEQVSEGELRRVLGPAITAQNQV